MKYDPIKRSLGNVFNTTPALRKLFYSLLDTLLLRSWFVKKELKDWRKSVDKSPRILDAGSGFGQYVYRMSQICPDASLLGVDVKDEQIADCNNFFSKIGLGNRVKFAVADLTKFDSEDEFDFILSVDVMEHIEDDVAVFKNFHKAMKEGGQLLISTPSDQGGSDSHDHDHDHDDASGFIDEHVRDGYGVEDITEKLTKAGFKDIECKYSYGKPGQLAWKLSMKYPILMLNTTKLLFLVLPFYYLLTFPLSALLNYMDVSKEHATGTGLIVKARK